MAHIANVPCTDGAADNCLKLTPYRMSGEEFERHSKDGWLPDDAVCDSCAAETETITVPCQDGTDPNCHGYVILKVTPAQEIAWEENDEIPYDAVCPACGSDQCTTQEDD